MGPRVIRQLEKIPFWSILAPTCRVAAPVIFNISRGVQHERNQVNVGRDQASRGRAFRAKARCVPAIKQPGRFQAETKTAEVFFPPTKGRSMKKLLIASAVSAAFAAPTLALAQAARAPTLSQVLDASGINVSGYIDAGYSYANRNIEATPQFRVFDAQNNSFVLHQFGLTVAKQPSRGFGGVVNITVGSDAQLIHSFPEVTASTFDLTQAYGQYSTGGLTLMAGKFVTLAGSEVIW